MRGILNSMTSTNIAQMLSNSGFDWLFIDMEHGGRTRVFSKYLTVKTIVAVYLRKCGGQQGGSFARPWYYAARDFNPLIELGQDFWLSYYKT